MKKLLLILLVCLLPLMALATTGTSADEVLSACLEALGEEWMICEDENGQPLFANGGSCAVAFVTDGARMSLVWFDREDGDWYDSWRTDEPLFGVEGLVPTWLDLYEEVGSLCLDCRLLWGENQLWVTAQQGYYSGEEWYVTEYTVLTPVDGGLSADDWVYLTKWPDNPPLLEYFSPVAQAQEPVVMEGSTLVCYPESRTDAYYAVPEGIEIIGENAFSGNDALVHVSLPESVRAIEDGAFAYCQNLRVVDMPSTLETLGEDAFECTYVQQLTIPEGLTALPEGAFCAADLQGTVVIPEGVTDIGAECFAFNAGITDLYLPASFETISGETFQQGATFWYIWDFNSVDAGETHMTIHAPAGTEAARFAIWSGYPYVVEDAREGTDLPAVTAWAQAVLDAELPGAEICENDYGFPCVTYSADTVFVFAMRERETPYGMDEYLLCCFDRTGDVLTLRWVNDGLYGTERWGIPEYPIPMEMALVDDTLNLGLRLGEEAAVWLDFTGEDFRLNEMDVCYWNKYTDGPPPYWATALQLPVTDGTPLQEYTIWSDFVGEWVVQGAVFNGDTVLLSMYDVIGAAGLDYTFQNNLKGIAHFEVGDTTWVLDEQAMTLTREDDPEQFNYILPAPGSTNFRSEIIDGHWMVDSHTVFVTFRSFLDWPIRISIDYDTQTVAVCAE